MRKPRRPIAHDLHQLYDDAHALVLATEHAVGKDVEEARKHLVKTLERGKHIYGEVENETYEGALTLDEAATKYLYHAVGILVAAVAGILAVLHLSKRKQ